MRKVLVLTGSRGEWGYLRPVLALFPQFNLQPYLVVTNMHVDPRFGNTEAEIISDGFTINERLPMNLSLSGNLKWCHELGVLAGQVAGMIERSGADAILVAGDRAESMIFVAIAYYAEVPICHIQAGEKSGHKDGAARHAIGKLAHIHFAANDDAANRLLELGEERHRIFNVGAPQIDDLMSEGFINSGSTVEHRGKLPEEFVLALFHSTIEDQKTINATVEQVYETLAQMQLHQIWILPNSDAGSDKIYETIMNFSRRRCAVHRNLSRSEFAYLLSRAQCLVGNSSAGILEAPSLGTWAINIGSRQAERLRSRSVMDIEHFTQSQFIEKLNRARNETAERQFKFGEGDAAEKICSILSKVDLGDEILTKRLTK